MMMNENKAMRAVLLDRADGARVAAWRKKACCVYGAYRLVQ
jgi:hypothetical protein